MLNGTIQGNGPNLVFLHGFCEDIQIWNQFAPRFQKDFKVVCIDLPGFGKSEDGVADLEVWAKSCLDFLSAHDFHEFSLIGHSMGGYVSLAMLEQAPERVRHYVSFHSTSVADTDEKKANRLRQVEIIKERGVTSYVNQLIPTLFKPGYAGPGLETSLTIARNQSPEGICSALLAMRERPDRTAVIQAFEAPLLVVSGRHDALLPLDGQVALAQAARNGEHAILVNSGHMGMIEEPEESYKIIQAFLKS